MENGGAVSNVGIVRKWTRPKYSTDVTMESAGAVTHVRLAKSVSGCVQNAPLAPHPVHCFPFSPHFAEIVEIPSSEIFPKTILMFEPRFHERHNSENQPVAHKRVINTWEKSKATLSKIYPSAYYFDRFHRKPQRQAANNPVSRCWYFKLPCVFVSGGRWPAAMHRYHSLFRLPAPLDAKGADEAAAEPHAQEIVITEPIPQ